MDKTKKRQDKQLVRSLEEFSGGDEQLHSDVQGSWTGNPLYDEEPVQDADDL